MLKKSYDGNPEKTQIFGWWTLIWQRFFLEIAIKKTQDKAVFLRKQAEKNEKQ